ncbi:MAG TPA: hypothetical protein DD716_05820 [Thiomicrospira sp.]|nr:hypothetical protein [Thiomicrospira sp.]
MCVLMVLVLIAMVWFYADNVLHAHSLVENIAGQSVLVAQGWGMLTIIWPVGLLFILIGMFLLLVFLKIKKVI